MSEEVVRPSSDSNRFKRSVYDLSLKQQLVQRVLNGESAGAVSREGGVGYPPPETLRDWVRKCRTAMAAQPHLNKSTDPKSLAEIFQGTKGLSRRPHHQPKLTSQWIIDKIIKLKKERPEMGARALSSHLLRFESVNLSRKTIGKIFKKYQLVDGDAGANEAKFRTRGDDQKQLEMQVEKDVGEWERFSRPNPNDLWQMDIMSFYIRDAHRVYLISALDDCSRMIVGWGLFRDQSAENVLEVLRGALVRFGAPKEILTDQGGQFKHWGGITQFEKLLRKLKVEHIVARSHHPQTCGKIEAFHKSIHRELIDKEYFVSQEMAVEKIARFIDHYNYGRPHTSLDGFTPSDKYFGITEALKKYISDYRVPKNPQEEGAPENVGVAKASKLYLVGKVLGQDIRIQELGGQLSIFLNQTLFKEINLLQTVQMEQFMT